MDVTQKNMHKLRVKGKSIKYLTQMELLELSPSEMVDAVLRLHDLLGDYNDFLEMADYFKESRFKDEAKNLMDSIQMEIFSRLAMQTSLQHQVMIPKFGLL